MKAQVFQGPDGISELARRFASHRLRGIYGIQAPVAEVDGRPGSPGSPLRPLRTEADVGAGWSTRRQ